MKICKNRWFVFLWVVVLMGFLPTAGFASLSTLGVWSGNVALSVDAVGSNYDPTGYIQAEIADGSTILAAYLYSAGTPYPWYSNSPTTLADYNGSGVTLAGQSVTFDTIVDSAVSDRPAIGQWYTARADVTSIVQSLLISGQTSYSWLVNEGSLTSRIDGEVLAIVYSNAALGEGSVALLDGGQATGGDTTVVTFADPLGELDSAFYANMSLGISFSTAGSQISEVDINGERLTSAAGGYDDGVATDGGLITAGGIGDSTDNPSDPYNHYAADDELYSLVPFLEEGDTGFTIYSTNPSDDDNIFFMGLTIAATIESVTPEPVAEPATMLLLLSSLCGLGLFRRGRK